MQHERLDFDFEIKRAPGGAGQGIFAGLASTFNGPEDSFGDLVAAGAFTKSLAAHRAKGTAPAMLWSHDLSSPIGAWTSLRETDAGLEVRGKLTLAVEKAREAWALIQDRALSGLSIGFRINKADSRKGGGRLIREVDLMEISLVSLPANPAARIEAAKAALARGDVPGRADLERLLRQAGLTKSQALRAAPAVRAALDPMTELRESIERARRALKG